MDDWDPSPYFWDWEDPHSQSLSSFPIWEKDRFFEILGIIRVETFNLKEGKRKNSWNFEHISLSTFFYKKFFDTWYREFFSSQITQLLRTVS